MVDHIFLHYTLKTQHRAVSHLLLWMETNCCWFCGSILREFENLWVLVTTAVSHGRSRAATNLDLVGIDGRRSTQQTCSGAGPQPLRILWKSGVKSVRLTS